MDAAREYLEAQLPKQTPGCLEQERCGSFCALCPMLSDCGASDARSDDGHEDTDAEEADAAHVRLTRSISAIRSPARSRRPSRRSRGSTEVGSRMLSPRFDAPRFPRASRPSLSSTISKTVGTLPLPSDARLRRYSVSSQPSLRSRRVTYKYSQLVHRVPRGSRRASLPPVFVHSRVSPVPFEVRIRPRRPSSVMSSRRPSTVGSSTPVWPRDSLGASRTSSLLGSSLAFSVGRTSVTRSLVGSSRWTLPSQASQASQASSPMLSSCDRLPAPQVVARKYQATSGSASTASGPSVNAGTPPHQYPDSPPMATVIEATEAETLEGTRLKAVRFRQGSASIIGSPMDEKLENMELNPRLAGTFGGA